VAKKKNPSKPQGQKGTPQDRRESVLQEAWNNMSRDFNRLLPEKLRARKGKKKFMLWLFILELLVLGLIGKLVYLWWVGR
jgi:hypothetical protein